MGSLERRDNDYACCRFLRPFFGIRRKCLLLTFILIGVAIGFIIGGTANRKVNAITDVEEKKTTIMLIGFPGELFMNMLKLLILPLIVASVVNGVASLDSAKTGRRTGIYFASTTFLAAILGIVLVSSIKPGKVGKPEVDARYEAKYRTVDSALDLIRSFFPPNIAEATINQRQTKYSKLPAKYQEYNKTVENSELNATSGIIVEFNVNATHKIVTVKEMVRRSYNQIPAGTSPVQGSSMNILGLVLFSIVFGVVLNTMGKRGKILKKLFKSLYEAVKKIIDVVMWFSPIGICSLIAAKVVRMDDISQSLEAWGLFMVTSVGGVLIHTFISLPLIYFIMTRNNPYKVMAKMTDALVIAWGTASSASTLPTATRCVKENLGVDSRITEFVLPVGATVNMNGGALYIAVGVIWIAQINNIPIDAEKIIAVCLSATFAAVGTSIPVVSLVNMSIVCDIINVPAEDIGLLFAIDWLIDRFCTFSNVMSTAFGADIVCKFSKTDHTEPGPEIENDEQGNSGNIEAEAIPLRAL